MKFIHVIFVVHLLVFEDVLSQRIISRPELSADNQQQQNQPIAPRGRGRARFSVTPEFEQVQADYEKTAKQDPQRSRGAKRVVTTNRRHYEVEEVLDDVPDNSRKYATRPRVVTEMRFEAVNAPKDTTLFVPSEGEVDKDALLKNAAPSSTSDAADGRPGSSTENAIQSSSETIGKVGDQTTEQELMTKELMKSSTAADSLPIKHQRNRPSVTAAAEEAAATPTKSRTRTRKRPPPPALSDPAAKSSSAASSNRKDDYLRKQELNRNSKAFSPPEILTKATDPEPQPQTVSQMHTVPANRNNFRSGRRRSGGEGLNQSDRESQAPTDFRRPRGPSVFQDVDTQPSRTRTGRKAVNSNRRVPSRTTNADQISSTTEQQQINRGRVADGRRGRVFSREPQQGQRLEEPAKETTTFAPRRRVPVKPTAATFVNNAAPIIRSRIIPPAADSIKSETTTKIFTVQPSRSINRSRSRFNPTNIDEQKLEVLPLFEAEPKTVTNRQQTFTRRRGRKESNNSDQKKNRREPISRSRSVVVARKETVTETAKPPTIQPTVKESVHSEISEVISTRKVTRPKPRGTTKAVTEATRAKASGEEDVDESDNYPEPFKALLHKQHKQTDAKDGQIKENEISPDIVPIVQPTAIVRPTRRRFSLATKPPHQDTNTKKPFVPSRKPTPPRPYKKYTTEALSVSVNSPTQRYHARFNGRLQESTLSDLYGPGDKATAYRRNLPTKGATPRKVVQDRPERKQIPIKGNKLLDQQNNTSAPLKKHGVAPSAASRYSSRYRGGDIGTRLHNAHAHSRGTTVVPVYVPTVPSITPSTTVSLPPDVHTEENDLGLQVISIDEPANSLFSDNLVVMGGDPAKSPDNSTSPSSVATEDNDQKQISILERIINSLTATTTASPSKHLTNTNERLARNKQTATDNNSSSSAIFKIASKKTSTNGNRSIKPALSNDLRNSITDSIGSDDSSEKPTTVIERIIDSLSAIQAIDSSTIDPIQVGTSANNLFNAPTKSMSYKRLSTFAPPPPPPQPQPSSQPTLIPARSVGDFIYTTPISGDTINMFLRLLNLGTASSTTESLQPQLFDLTTPTLNPQSSSSRSNVQGSAIQSNTFSPSGTFGPSTPRRTTFGPTIYPTTFAPANTIFDSFRSEPTTTFKTPSTTAAPLVRHFTIPPSQTTTFSTERNVPTSFRIPSSLFTTDRPITVSSTVVTNPVTQLPVATTTHNNRDDVELLSTISIRDSVRIQPTTTPQTQTTVAISLADFLASLNQTPSPTRMQTNIAPIIPVTSTLPTVIDTTTYGIESSTAAFRDLTPSTVTVTQQTNVPTTVTAPTAQEELKNRGLLENFIVSPESVRIISANDLSQTTFNPDVLSILPLFSDLTTTTPQAPSSTQVMTDTTTNDITTTTSTTNTDPIELTTVTTDTTNLTASLATTTDLDNNIITSTDRPLSNMSQSQNMSMTNRLIADFMRDNAIKPPTSDYYVFAILPNNTIVRKRPRAFVPQDSPYIIVGVYPNNTVVHKYPNGTIVPEEPLIQVSGFDTREFPPPLPDLTSNQVTSTTTTTTTTTSSSTTTSTQGSDHIVDNTSTRMDNIVQNVVSSSVEANLRSLDSSNSSSMIQSTTSPATPTTLLPNFESNDNSIIQLNEILVGKTIEEFNTIVNKTMGSKDVKEVEDLVTSRPNIEEIDIDNNVISTRAKPEKVIISTTGSPTTMTDAASTNTISPTTNPTTARVETTTFVPYTVQRTTINPTTILSTTTDNPTTTFVPTTFNPTTQFTTSTSTATNPNTFVRTQPPPANGFSNNIVQPSTLPPFLANLLSTAIVQETNPPNVPTIFGISRTTSNRPTTTTEPYRGITTTVTALPTEVLDFRTTNPPIYRTQAGVTNAPRINVVPVTPANPSANTPLDVQAILRLLEEYTGRTITPRSIQRTTRRTTTASNPTTDLENEIDTSSRFVELITQSPNPRRRFRTTTVSTTIPTTTEPLTTTTTIPTTVQPTIIITTTVAPTTTTTIPTTTFIPTTHQPTRRTAARIRNIVVPTTTEKQFQPTIDPTAIDTETLIARAKKRPLTEQQKQDLATLEALENEQKALLEQLSLLTNLNGNRNKPTSKPGNSNSNSLASRIIAFASERDRTTTEKLPELTLGEQLDSSTNRNQPKIAVINGKAVPVDEFLKKINDNGINSVSSTYGSSNDAILAAILKEQGIGPTTPEVLSNIYKDITTTRRTTPRSIHTTARPAPGPIMQGLSWILNAIGPQNPPTNSPPRRFRTSAPTTPRPTTIALDELQTQTSLKTTQFTRAPTTTAAVQLKRPVNSLSDNELQKLISQLEEIQKDPRKAKELDLTNLRKLQTPTQQSQRLRDSVQLVHSGEQGTIPGLDEDNNDSVFVRGRKAKSTTSPPVVSVSNSISAEDFDVDEEVVVVTRAPARAQQRPRQTQVVPVQLNPIRGIDSVLGGGFGLQGDGGQVRGSLITAAVNVTRAISTFFGSAIQAAAQQVANMIATPTADDPGLSSTS